MGLDERMVT